MLFNLKTSRALFALGVLSGCSVYSAGACAEAQPDKLMLKPSVKLVLNEVIDADKMLRKAQAPRSVLASLELFRGVTVDLDPPAHAETQNRENRESVQSEKTNPLIKAVYGGLQIALKDNVSLVYSPGRLSREGFDSNRQGLYLLRGDGGHANWFLGVESGGYARSSDIRRNSNTAQFGVILSLD